MMKALLVVSWGFGSDTYDFYERFVECDDTGKIIRIYWLARLRYWLCGETIINFGHGYDCARELLNALNSRQIPTHLWRKP